MIDAQANNSLPVHARRVSLQRNPESKFQNPKPIPPFKFADEIPPHPLEWLWPNRIPRAALTLLVGDPGVGKSLLAAEITARLSKAQPWPDAVDSQPRIAPPHPNSASSAAVTNPNSEFQNPKSPGPEPQTPNPRLGPSVPQPLGPSACLSLNPEPRTLNPPSGPFPQGAILASTDDRTEDALLPRLTAAGADLRCVSIIDIPRAREDFGLDAQSHNPYDPTPFSALSEAIRAHTRPALLVLDTLPALGLTPADGLPALFTALTELARRYDIAILASSHLAKTRGNRPIYRVRGSLNYVAAARTVLSLTQDERDPNARILLTLKSAYGGTPPPLRFRINAGPKLEWDEAPLQQVPTDLLDLAPEAQSALTEATDWLRQALLDGPIGATEIIRAANAVGISTRTLKRAKRLLRIAAQKAPQTGKWSWFPPDTPSR